MRAALALLVIVVGSALAPTSAAGAVVVPAVPQVGTALNVIEVDRRCRPGRVWIRGHRNRRGYWVRGHCGRRR